MNTLESGDVIIRRGGMVQTIENIRYGEDGEPDVVEFEGEEVIYDIFLHKIRTEEWMRISKDDNKGAVGEILDFINNVVCISWCDGVEQSKRVIPPNSLLTSLSKGE